MRTVFPSAERLRSSRLLGWLGPRLHEPYLWRWRRRAVARGVAIGAFFAVLLPIGQTALAVISCFLLRGNLVAAAGATFISNPLSFGPIYLGAYWVGAVLLGMPSAPVEPDAMPPATPVPVSWGDLLLSHGPALLAGIPVTAVMAGVLGYLGTSIVWRIRVSARLHSRARARRRARLADQLL